MVVLRLEPRPSDDPSAVRKDRTLLEDGRGRFAKPPSEIPARGWKERVYEGISEDRILANARKRSHSTLLVLFPAIAALVSIYESFADPDTIGPAAHWGIRTTSGVARLATSVERDQDQRSRSRALRQWQCNASVWQQGKLVR
jgi:hypothetical protein